MCEFKVHMIERGKERIEVAKNIIAVKKKDENIILVNDLGTVTLVSNANIEEVNTFTQEMILKRID